MRKNGSRIISFARYRITDLLLFAIILVAFELISFFAFTEWFSDDLSRYTFSLVVPISLIVMVRWNWYGMFYAVLDGLVYCILLVARSQIESADALEYFLVFAIGNAFIGLCYLLVRFLGRKRIVGKWYFTLLYVVCGWVCIVIGRSVVSVFFGNNFFSQLLYFAGWDLLSLAIALVIMFILRRLDGMLERQKDYLLRLDRERKERFEADNFGEKPIEIDEETFKSLNKKGDDLF